MEFIDKLNSETISDEDIVEKAPWLQMENESDEEYLAFCIYLQLPRDKWKVKDAHESSDGKLNLISYRLAYNRHSWYERRHAYVSWIDYRNRRDAEAFHVQQLQNYRDNQVRLTTGASELALELLELTKSRISELDTHELGVKDIPQYIKAIIDILRVTSDTEAQALALSDLMELYKDEMIQSKQIIIEDPLEENIILDPLDVWEEELKKVLDEQTG